MKRLIKIALHFNECIKNQDLEGLIDLMTEDHLFIDRENNIIQGKTENTANWKKFFELYPVYENNFENILVKDNRVILQGYSTCCDEILNNVKAIWVAEISDNKVKEWRIYSDNEENRKQLL